MTDRELMQLALEALTAYDGTNGASQRKRVLAALRDRLAHEGKPNYTTPREWEGLDDGEVVGLTCECVDDGTFNMDCAFEFARSIETKLRERNA